MGASLCKQCGYRWNHPQRVPESCPSCKSQHWNEDPDAESCSMDGGICDQCGCKFFVVMMEAKFCPHCGKDSWDSGKVTENPSVLKVTENLSKEYECTKCGHRWFSRHQSKPRQRPRKNCQTRKIQEVLK